MPYIEAKLSIKLDESQKAQLQTKFTDIISSALSKPKSYIMVNVEDAKSLYFGAASAEKGAYIAISSLGTTISKSSCQTATKEICSMLSDDYGLNDSNIYITYHPVELWGWRGSMF